MEIKNMCSVLARIRPRLPTATHCTRRCSGVSQQSPAKKPEIKIPNRIDRGPTDILRALSNTIQTDYTAPHYKYHDDPFLIPLSNIGKRTFALAKESGKKAAQWIMAQNAELFNARTADPAIPAFLPKLVFTPDSKVTENDLHLAIDGARVEEALQIYDIMQKQGQTVSLEARQALLEFLSYFNSEETLPEEFIEERWFLQFQKKESRQKKSWNDAGMAQALFDSIKEELQEGPALNKAKCALLRGMAKYCQADRGWEMYKTMRSAAEPIDVDTYNQIFKLVGFVRDTIEKRSELVEEMLREMNANKVKPNIGTLNAILDMMVSSSGQSQTKTFATRLIAEFKLLGIKPSLASYYHLLNIFSRDRGPKSGVLQEIITILESEGPLEIRDPKDTFFFVTAMDVCKNSLEDPALARRVHNLLLSHNNYDFIGDTYKESIYYRLFFSLLINLEPLDEFMKIYNKYVPNIYIPEPGNMEDIVRSIDLHGSWEMLPQIWSDLVVFDQINRDNLVTAWFNTAVKANVVAPFESAVSQQDSVKNLYVSVEPDDPQQILATSFYEAAKHYWEKVASQPKRFVNKITWSGVNLGNCMILAVRANKYNFAVKILDKLLDEYNGAPPSVESLRIFMKRAVAENDLDSAVKCIVFACETGFAEAAMLADELKQASQLKENQISKINSALGIL
ncbi:small ribosomal subunit protein mS39 [Neocloeon triangulifer]|uniref:small ribosomal subunit protein mS39 n=1 Tax=Neocloeon triangulifer TaxID=2078957 RepID=UPI00286EDFE4|nr:small ribosomal subunit protein mS39 [Neocloeon triangulifer]